MPNLRRKKSLVGWTHKDWVLHWDYVAGFGQAVCHCEIMKSRNSLSYNDIPTKIRITIEELFSSKK